MTNPTTTNFDEASPRAQAAIIEAVQNPDIVNPVTIARCEEICEALMATITPTTPIGEVRAIHTRVWKLRDANRQRPRSPFLQGLKGLPTE